ncbi:hypothetical protein D3C85_1362900 [compost metagenome]
MDLFSKTEKNPETLIGPSIIHCKSVAQLNQVYETMPFHQKIGPVPSSNHSMDYSDLQIVVYHL